MVFKTAERRNNTAERLLQSNPPIFTQAWLSTLAEVKADPLGAIWVRPADYRETITGSSFDIEPRRGRTEYLRQSAREAFVEGRVQKSRLQD